MLPMAVSAEHSLRTEIRLLAELAVYLPLPIPRFDYVADPPGQHVPFLPSALPPLNALIFGQVYDDQFLVEEGVKN